MIATLRPRRGDIWLVDFGTPIGREQAGRRPAVIVSDDLMNIGPSGLVIVVPLTSTHRRLPSHVEIEPDGGLDVVSYAKCEDVKSISTERLVHLIGAVGETEINHVTAILARLLAM
ncbi:MAG TPA: type II toxin-antitoxin system PemK/MazF family toxin [Ilumatobacteraceae bacterium]|nr:type II toxin-antitoxin system PemK/MazF family toxin [Ilumatobacteraceae bacterium]